MKIIIVGGSFAGIEAAKEIRLKYPKATIYLIEKESKIGFIPSSRLLNSGVKTNVSPPKYWIDAKELETNFNITVLTGLRAEKIIDNNVLLLSNEEELSYDKLIIATGAGQDSRLITLENMSLVRVLKSSDSIEKLSKIIPDVEHIAVIGAGMVGIELADTLSKHGKKVTLYDAQDQILYRCLDKEMAEVMESQLAKTSVTLRLDHFIESLTVVDSIVQVSSSEADYAADLALIATSTRPDNTTWNDKIVLNHDGTIWTDDYFQTSLADVYAIGDATTAKEKATGEQIYISLVNNARRTARIVSNNLEEALVRDEGSLRILGNNAFGYFFGSVGLTETDSLFYANEIKTKIITQRTAVLSKEKDEVKLIYRADDEVLLGAQIISKRNIFDRLNILGLCISRGLTRKEMITEEMIFQAEYTTFGLLESGGQEYED